MYGALSLGITVLIVLFLLDSGILIRLYGHLPNGSGFSMKAELDRLLHGSKRMVEMLANFGVFVPFGFFLSEFLSEMKRYDVRRRFVIASLAGFGFSLTIECLQLILHAGYFELTDLVMNTMGGFLGASLSAVGRTICVRRFQVKSGMTEEARNDGKGRE